MSSDKIIDELLASIRMHRNFTKDTAHIEIHGNKVLGASLVNGLSVDAREKKEGIAADIKVQEGTRINNPVHLCFGMLPEKGIQRIELKIHIENKASVNFLAHCTFPNAVDIQHLMDAEIIVGKGARYKYFERHVHGEQGGVMVVPKARIILMEGAHFSTEFELIKGRAGSIEIDYETICHTRSIMEMKARISGSGNDSIKIRESGILEGEYSRGILISYIALRDEATAEIVNELVAKAPYAQGHVDCKEIVMHKAIAKAVPIVQVSHPKAHVTHEAAIGSVDSKQLQTLMSRGLSEDEAIDLIIRGLLG